MAYRDRAGAALFPRYHERFPTVQWKCPKRVIFMVSGQLFLHLASSEMTAPASSSVSWADAGSKVAAIDQGGFRDEARGQNGDRFNIDQ